MIEPKVTFAQVLKVPATRVTVGSMQQDHQTKAGFAERLNELVAEQGEIPEKVMARFKRYVSGTVEHVSAN